VSVRTVWLWVLASVIAWVWLLVVVFRELGQAVT
jgi:hypothetical protein